MRELYSEVDGDFPNHHPDPSKPENLADLIRTVAAGDAELGLAFDGDGDRLGVVTKDGKIIYPDRQLMLFARDVLQRNTRRARSSYDVKCSQRLAPLIRAAGGVPLMWKTGHSLVKAKMQRDRRAARRRDERPHLLRRALVRLRRRHLHRGAAARDPVSASARPERGARTRCRRASARPSSTSPCAEGEPARGRASALRAEAKFPGAARSSRSTACASSTTTASA